MKISTKKLQNNICECQYWARTGQIFVTKHHPDCEKYAPEDDAFIIIKALLKGIEAWASDEDGVHPECWDAYKRARYSINMLDSTRPSI